MPATPAPTPTSNPYADEGDQADGFVVRISNKHLEYRGLLGGYESLTCVARHNAISTAELVVRSDHPRVAELLLPGARLVIDYNHNFLMSGRMESRGASANAGNPTVTFNMVDDFQYFGLMLGWPNPDESIDDQGHEPGSTVHLRYFKAEGLASNVVKYFVYHNRDRLALPLDVYGTSDDLGAWIHARSRMDTLADVLVAKVDQAGLGMRIGGYGTDGNLALRFYVPTVRDHVLTVDSGALVDWSWTQAEPTATRVVLGGAGEGSEREYQTFIDAERETIIGTIKEVYVEARDIGSDYEDALKNVKDTLADKVKLDNALEVQTKVLQAARDKQDHAADTLADAIYRRDHATNPSDDYTEAVNSVARWTTNYNDATLSVTGEDSDWGDIYDDQQAAIDAYNAALVKRDAEKIAFDEEMRVKSQHVFGETSTEYGLSLTLAETPGFRYGDTFVVGDTVTVALPNSITITDVVREVTISDTVDAGLVVSPTIGTQDTMAQPNRILVYAIKKSLAAIRKLNTSR